MDRCEISQYIHHSDASCCAFAVHALPRILSCNADRSEFSVLDVNVEADVVQSLETVALVEVASGFVGQFELFQRVNLGLDSTQSCTLSVVDSAELLAFDVVVKAMAKCSELAQRLAVH